MNSPIFSAFFVESPIEASDSSLLSSSYRDNTREESVKVVDARTFSQENLSSFDSIVIKCDTQGYDAKILARMFL